MDQITGYNLSSIWSWLWNQIVGYGRNGDNMEIL